MSDAQPERPGPGSGALIGVWRWEFETGLFFADERICRLFGVPCEWGWVGGQLERFLEQIHHEDRRALQGRLASIAARSQPLHKIYRVLGPGRSEVWVRSMGLPMPQQDKAQGSYLGLITAFGSPPGFAPSLDDELVETLLRAHDLAAQIGDDIVVRLLEVVLLELGRRIAAGMSERACHS